MKLSQRLASCLLKNLIRPTSPQSLKTPFDSIHPPAVSLDKYLARFEQYAFYDKTMIASGFCYALTYLERWSQRNKQPLSECNIHRLSMTAIGLAIKFSTDDYYDNKTLAKIGGVSLTEYNQLETTFCCNINFQLNLTLREFIDSYLQLYSLNDWLSDIALALTNSPPSLEWEAACIKTLLNRKARSLEDKHRVVLLRLALFFLSNHQAAMAQFISCICRSINDTAPSFDEWSEVLSAQDQKRLLIEHCNDPETFAVLLTLQIPIKHELSFAHTFFSSFESKLMQRVTHQQCKGLLKDHLTKMTTDDSDEEAAPPKAYWI